MSVLDEICARKREHISARKLEVAQSTLESQIKNAPTPRGFLRALQNHTIRAAGGAAIIAEVKKASPSVGVIRTDFDPVAIAKIYEQNGAACLSVLTDAPYFQGDDSYLADIRASVSLPLLRKDFMLDPYQIFESRALGADCILLIMAALTDNEYTALYDLSVDLGMDVLTEIHDAAELERAIKLRPPMMIGVNNRSLKTLKVDVQTSLDLAPLIPPGTFKIAESGLSGPEIVRTLYNAGYGAFLIGESLMRSADIGGALRQISRF